MIEVRARFKEPVVLLVLGIKVVQELVLVDTIAEPFVGFESSARFGELPLALRTKACLPSTIHTSVAAMLRRLSAAFTHLTCRGAQERVAALIADITAMQNNTVGLPPLSSCFFLWFSRLKSFEQFLRPLIGKTFLANN